MNVRGCIVVALVAWGGCSAPATLPELVRAEQLADHGDVDGAVREYHAAQAQCRRLSPERRARQACSDALLGEAEALDRAGRTDDAIAVYQAVPSRVVDDPMTAATATYRAATLLLPRGNTAEAWTLLWQVVTDWPDEPLASDALKLLLDDGRARDPRALADQFGKLLTPLADTEVGDNLVWSLAQLEANELANLPAARSLYDRIPVDYPASGLRDDARWFAAQVSLQLGDANGAVTRLRALLATREVALGPGSYFSIWLDDAQLELGRVLRDQLHDPPGAIAAFERLPKDYPASTLRDDALYELAVTANAAGDSPRACRAIAALRKQFPDSKRVESTRELARGCP